MVFSSPIFVFAFLPLVLIVYYLSARPFRNVILLVFSLLFYAWGESERLAVMLLSISLNYVAAILIDKTTGQTSRKAWLVMGMIANLGMLIYYKYTFFAISNYNVIAQSIGWHTWAIERIVLPLGISFFTFQGMSYVIDVYRRSTPVQTNPLNLALYITFFPQLIAGPIVRYHDISLQINVRSENLSLFTSGIKRFITGLAKKVLIADALAQADDIIFSYPIDNLGTGMAWLALAIAAMRIYFDFSGYSDMAIGMGRMFGFRFLENFNFPLSVTNMRSFWNHWHISLSNWFRDYVYIPLGGNRKGPFKTQFNLWLIFFLSGLWHGSEWTFVIFGAYHGIFMVAERIGLDKWLNKTPVFIQNIYVWLIFSFSMVFFRSPDLPFSIAYMQQLFTWHSINPYHEVWVHLQPYFWAVLLTGLIFCYPITRHILSWADTHQYIQLQKRELIIWFIYSILFLATIAAMASSSYSPFIYFRF